MGGVDQYQELLLNLKCKQTGNSMNCNSRLSCDTQNIPFGFLSHTIYVDNPTHCHIQQSVAIDTYTTIGRSLKT